MSEENQSVLAAIMSLSQQVATIDKNLAVNTTKTESVESQVIKTNGTVGKHDVSIGQIQQAIALLTQTISQQQKLIEKVIAVQDQKEEKNSDWKSGLLDKAGWGVLVFLGIIIYTLLIRTHTLAPLNTLNNTTPTTTR